MIFDLYEDILSHSWHRFYYGAEAISEEEKDTICQLFGSSRGLTFTDEVLDIIGIRNA